MPVLPGACTCARAASRPARSPRRADRHGRRGGGERFRAGRAPPRRRRSEHRPRAGGDRRRARGARGAARGGQRARRRLGGRPRHRRQHGRDAPCGARRARPPRRRLRGPHDRRDRPGGDRRLGRSRGAARRARPGRGDPQPAGPRRRRGARQPARGARRPCAHRRGALPRRRSGLWLGPRADRGHDAHGRAGDGPPGRHRARPSRRAAARRRRDRAGAGSRDRRRDPLGAGVRAPVRRPQPGPARRPAGGGGRRRRRLRDRRAHRGHRRRAERRAPSRHGGVLNGSTGAVRSSTLTAAPVIMGRVGVAANPVTRLRAVTAFADRRPLSETELQRAPVRYPRPSVLARELKVEGAKANAAAATLGLATVGDLLEHLPRDRREARAVGELVIGEVATVAVEVRAISSRPVRRRGMRPLVEATVADASGSMRATFFNQPWLARRYAPGTRLMLHGKYEAQGRFRVQGHALTRDARVGASGPEEGEATASAERAIAHYPATEGLSSTQILALVRAHGSAFAEVDEPLPARLRALERLPARGEALAAMHFGDDERVTGEALRRLAFEELLLVQLALLRRRRLRRAGARAPALSEPPSLSARWLSELLPFEPTGDQRRAMAEIDADLALPRPMQRLLMGEVGSGKTVVALYALLRAVEHGHQGALMAPTEPLAEQHFQTIQALMGGEAVRIGLLTGSTPARRRADLLGKLATGELSLLVGTHALIEDPVRFDSLAVAVIDEQHRFGVRQRAALEAKAADGRGCGGLHSLHMTATPIPRTLALSHYGDLDFTVLAELPRGRRPIDTHVCATDAERARAYERMREELRAGRQAFVVCPLVSESEALAARAATAEYERLSAGELRDFRVLLMHGQLPSAEKLAVMQRFAAGEADVLVATTVIEVGIDVPNATVMLIEDAERYGISQLHQLRGRIGRGEHRSLCLLFGPKGSARLQALAAHTDGFRLAEIDLELRGEGELVGVRQSGLAQFRVAELPRDRELQERARLRAEAIDSADPELAGPEHRLLGDALAERFGDEALAPIRA